MKKVLLFSLLLLLISFQARAFDFPEVKGWKPVSDVTVYSPDNLYEYINGAADQYLDYGFVLLHTRDLDGGAVQVALDIYDMGSRLNAFGIYKTERPANQERLAIGTEAVISPPYQCILLKDNYYVKVNVFEGEITRETGKQLLKSVTEALPGKAGFPTELELLPDEGKIPDSESFAKNNYLGLTELTNCVYAAYKDGEKKFQYFILLPTNDEDLEEKWNSAVSKWNTVPHKKFRIMSRKIPYKGLNGILLQENIIFGVTDCADESELISRLTAGIKRNYQ